MKVLTIIVHTNVQQDLTHLLRSIKEVSGFTLSHVEGHGIEAERDSFLAARDKVVGVVPRVRTDILLEDAHVDPVLKRLCSTDQCIAGQGIYWVTSVEKGGHLK